jgi:hypothetical protein
MGEFIIELIVNILFEVIFAAIGRFFRWVWEGGKSVVRSFMLIAPDVFRRPPKTPVDAPEAVPSLMEADSPPKP